MPKEKPKTPFAQALAARKGEIPPEALSPAAKQLYKDNSLTQEALKAYDKSGPRVRTLSVSRTHTTFKY